MAVEAMIRMMPSLIEQKSPGGSTPLLLAAGAGHVKVVTFLLDHHANISAKNNAQEDALYVAAWKGRMEIVALLLKRGANINTKQSSTGYTPLMMAWYHGINMLKLLLSHKEEIEVNTQDDEGRTALYWNALIEDPEAVKLLLEAEADPTIASKGGLTPLDAARDTEKNKDRHSGGLNPYADSKSGHDESIRLLEVSMCSVLYDDPSIHA